MAVCPMNRLQFCRTTASIAEDVTGLAKSEVVRCWYLWETDSHARALSSLSLLRRRRVTLRSSERWQVEHIAQLLKSYYAASPYIRSSSIGMRGSVSWYCMETPSMSSIYVQSASPNWRRTSSVLAQASTAPFSSSPRSRNKSGGRN